MKIFAGSLSVFVIVISATLCVLMLLSDDEDINMIGFLQTHSYVYTSDLETFSVPLLISEKDHYYVLDAAIVSATIESDTTLDKIPVEVVGVTHHGAITVDQGVFHHVDFMLKPGLGSDDLAIRIDNAYLVVTYYDAEQIRVPMGAFNYRFGMGEAAHLSMHTRFNLHQQFDLMPSSVGLIFSLENKTASPVEIISIHLNSNSVIPNMGYLRPYQEDLESFLAVDAILGHSYDFFETPHDQREPIILDAGDLQQYMIPFTYELPLYPLHRYPVIVDYVYEGAVYSMVIDDFMFIKTHPFMGDSSAFYEVVHND